MAATLERSPAALPDRQLARGGMILPYRSERGDEGCAVERTGGQAILERFGSLRHGARRTGGDPRGHID